MIRLELPFPPTVNNLFINAAKGRGRFPSPQYKLWRKIAGEMILAQGRHSIRGRVTLSIAIARPDRRRRDISNLIKAVEDLLVEMGVIEDDSLVERLSIQWIEAGPACAVIIHQWEQDLAA